MRTYVYTHFPFQRCFLRKSRGGGDLTTSHKTQEALLLDQMRFMMLGWESLQLGSLSDPVMDVPVSKMYSARVPNDPDYLLCLYPRKLNTPLLTVTGLWRKGIGHPSLRENYFLRPLRVSVAEPRQRLLSPSAEGSACGVCVHLTDPTEENGGVPEIMNLMLRDKCRGTRSFHLVGPEGVS